MKCLEFGHRAFGICAAAISLVGCGVLPLSLSKGQDDTQAPISAPNALPQSLPSSSSSYKILHRFSLERGGAVEPLSGLINVSGTLYGTTFGNVVSGYSTLFGISTSGGYKTLYRFHGADGFGPWDAPLVDVNGTLYGTTYYGGSGDGVVFSVTTAGVETVIHRFTGGSDGAHPWAALIYVNGTLYGTTEAGGSGCPVTRSSGYTKGCGTVFSISSSGKERVLYRFAGKPDGAHPGAALLDVNGMLYGTTSTGGAYGEGCVFTIGTSGNEKVLYSFSGEPDGDYPIAPLINVKGTLYGTTHGGGASGDGTVFSISTAGAETVLYSFAGGSADGAGPAVPLLDVNGTLYGTTDNGGGDGCSLNNGCGTVYSVSTSGAEQVLHLFTGGSDGAVPHAALVNVDGMLYGTTAEGGKLGCHREGCGTVFAITP